MPIIAIGNPYVSIIADHSDPGSILKYAPKPYLKNKRKGNIMKPTHLLKLLTYESSVQPSVNPIVPKETCRCNKLSR